MSWIGAIPLVFDTDDVSPEETSERIAKLGVAMVDLATEHGFQVIPQPQNSDDALVAYNACHAGMQAARSAYTALLQQEAAQN